MRTPAQWVLCCPSPPPPFIAVSLLQSSSVRPLTHLFLPAVRFISSHVKNLGMRLAQLWAQHEEGASENLVGSNWKTNVFVCTAR